MPSSLKSWKWTLLTLCNHWLGKLWVESSLNNVCCLVRAELNTWTMLLSGNIAIVRCVKWFALRKCRLYSAINLVNKTSAWVTSFCIGDWRKNAFTFLLLLAALTISLRLEVAKCLTFTPLWQIISVVQNLQWANVGLLLILGNIPWLSTLADICNPSYTFREPQSDQKFHWNLIQPWLLLDPSKSAHAPSWCTQKSH